MKTQFKSGRIIGLISISLISLIIFSRTQAFKAAGMYAFIGLKAPLEIRYKCLKTSLTNVRYKFTLPLDFDSKSKAALRTFWHFSYMRECLNNNGYDTHGIKLASSEVIQAGSTHTYINHVFNFKISSISDIDIISDNQMDADYDDRILASKLEIGDMPLNIYVYTKHDQITDLQSAQHTIQYIPYTNGPIKDSKILENNQGITYVYIDQFDSVSALVFITPEGKVTIISSDSSNTDFFTKLADSLSFN